MSALAPVQSRESGKRGCKATPAAMRRNPRVSRCCRSGDSTPHSLTRTNVRTNTLRIVSLKTRLVAAFCCVLAFSAVAMATEAERPGLKRSQGGRLCTGYWEALKKTFNLWKAFILVCALGVAMAAMFGDFTCDGANPDFGRNLFADEGASRWLRLAFVIPGLVLSIGGTCVAMKRIYKRTTLPTDQDYEDWKRGEAYQGFDAMKFCQRNTDKKLEMAFLLGLVVLAVISMVAGWKNWDNGMFIGTVITMLLIGSLGFSYKVWEYKTKILPAQAAKRSATEPTVEEDSSNTSGSGKVRRRLAEILERM